MKIKTAKTSVSRKTIAKKKVRAAGAKAPAQKCAKKAVQFTLHAEKGKAVYLAGEFNKWNPTARKMAFKAGVYTVTLRLAPGAYQYKFVVDGTWCADPANADSVPNDQGTFNSLVTVR